jgi:exodeoxyribonuclease-5
MRHKGCPDPQTIHKAIYLPKGTSGNRKLVTLLRTFLEMKGLPKEQALRAEIKPILQAECDALNPTYQNDKKADASVKESKKLLSVRRALATDLNDTAVLKDLVVANPIFEKNPESHVKDASLIVMDECSMISNDIMTDILSFNVPVLLQGDRAQLPPVGGESWFKGKSPDFSLTQIHRQAADSPIIYLATLAREGKSLPVGEHGNCLVTNVGREDLAMAADQILVGTHKQRWKTNDRIRLLKGYISIYPEVGERVICRHNDGKLGLINGEQYYVDNIRENPGHLTMSLVDEEGEYRPPMKCHKDYFHKKDPNPYAKSSMACIDYAHSCTVHSAQGSQWENVYVIDESRKFGADSRKHLYTAITRASEKVVVRVP